MTLIAMRAGEDFAEILTDTLAYGTQMMVVRPCTKTDLVSHLDTAVATQGAQEFGGFWKAEATSCNGAPDVDALTEYASRYLPALWAEIDSKAGPREFAQVFHVGWSPQRRRFVAYVLDSREGFDPLDVTSSGVHAFPPPVDEDFDLDSAQDWARLGKALRRRYSLASPMTGQQCLIGGRLVLTRIERGSVTQRTVHTFPSDDQEHRLSLAGTMHPLGQLGPCVCGSGQPYLVCHLRWAENDPCPCTSGRTFRDCHRIDPDSPRARRHWRKYVADYRTTKARFAAAYEAARPGEDGPPPPHVVDA